MSATVDHRPTTAGGAPTKPPVRPGATPTTGRIRRYDRKIGDQPEWRSFQPITSSTVRVLNLLARIGRRRAGTMIRPVPGTRGVDPMRINGVNRLARKVLDVVARDRSTTVTIEPIRGSPERGKPIADLAPFFEANRVVPPYPVDDGNEPGREPLRVPADSATFEGTTKCVPGVRYTASCPVRGARDTYFGPAAIAGLGSFIIDPGAMTPRSGWTSSMTSRLLTGDGGLSTRYMRVVSIIDEGSYMRVNYDSTCESGADK